jgi:hypothetical protein
MSSSTPVHIRIRRRRKGGCRLRVLAIDNEAAAVVERIYRCSARTLVPGTPVAGLHSAKVYLREGLLRWKVNAWIGTLFSSKNLVQTSEALAAVDDGHESASLAIRLAQRVHTAEAAMVRLRRALEAGWDSAALTEHYNAAVAETRSAEAELSAVRVPEWVSAEDIRKMVQELGDKAAALAQADGGRHGSAVRGAGSASELQPRDQVR